jgi:hypothetical protein
VFSGAGSRRYEYRLEDIPDASACDDEDEYDLPRGECATKEESESIAESPQREAGPDCFAVALSAEDVLAGEDGEDGLAGGEGGCFERWRREG